MGLLSSLLRLFGFGGGARPAARQAAAPPVAKVLTPEELRAQRRAIVAYVSQARVPIRLTAAARQVWLADLSKVYASIATAQTMQVLEQAGIVGMNHEPGFRDALVQAQAIEPPPGAEALHQAMVGWITSLHAACLSLIDARKLRDRALLGDFRENLGRARHLAAKLVDERTKLFAHYKLNVRPAIRNTRVSRKQALARARRRRAQPQTDAPESQEKPEPHVKARPKQPTGPRAKAELRAKAQPRESARPRAKAQPAAV
jgi:hypothetical protein